MCYLYNGTCGNRHLCTIFFFARFEIRRLVTRDTTNSLNGGVGRGVVVVVCFWKLMDGRLAWRIDGFPRDPTARRPPPLRRSPPSPIHHFPGPTPPRRLSEFRFPKLHPSPPTGRSNGTDTSLGVPSLMTNCFPARAAVSPSTDRVNHLAAAVASFAVRVSFLIHLATSYIILYPE